MHAYRAVTLSILLALPSCGGNVVVDKEKITEPGVATCETVCPKLQEACPGQTDSCTLMCSTFENFANQGACPTEIATYFVCLDEHPSFACNATEGTCDAEAQALAMCLVDFCTDQPGGC